MTEVEKEEKKEEPEKIEENKSSGSS